MLVSGLAAYARAQPLYTLRNLNSLAMQTGRPATHGINIHGDVVGKGYAITSPQIFVARPYCFDYSAGALVNLGDLAGTFSGGTTESVANRINDAGWVVGQAINSASQSRPYLWRDDNGNGSSDSGEMRELLLNPGATTSTAIAINNADQVLITGNGLWRWTDANHNHVQDAGEMLQVTTTSATIATLNDSGGVLWAETGFAGKRWLDASGDGVVDTGEVASIPANILGGTTGTALALNSSGQVCGFAKASSNDTHGFLWTDLDASNTVDAGEVIDIAPSAGTNFFARSMNNHGVVVGGLTAGSTRTAYSWDAANGFRNLMTAYAPSSGISLKSSQAEAINDEGQISLYGAPISSTSEYTYLLAPIVPADLDTDGDVDSADLTIFSSCGTRVGIAPMTVCEKADFDQDGDVDLSDFGRWQRCYRGSGVPVLLHCMD